jgi:hypothetical protein
MVAMFEVVFLILCVALGVWWFLRTSLYKAHRRSPGQIGDHSLTGRGDQNSSGPR